MGRDIAINLLHPISILFLKRSSSSTHSSSGGGELVKQHRDPVKLSTCLTHGQSY
jgi:hypothetical protein